jgi:Raf kinase inhibitor-like YbhB/YbcL family protein
MRRIVALSCLAVGVSLGAAGCKHDGRTLRPARPDQNATISTTAAPTTADASVDGGGAFSTFSTFATVPTTITGPTVSAPWRDGAEIDPRYTCQGEDVAPALLWSAPPAGTVEIAITMVDDDSPDQVHWVIAGLPASLSALAEGQVPAGAIQAANDFGTVGYAGPCNDSGTVDTYRFTVHFLSQQMELGDGAPGADLRLAVEAATFASADITGLYSRP